MWYKSFNDLMLLNFSGKRPRQIGVGLIGDLDTVLKDLWTLELIESYVISTNVDGFSCLNIDFD